MTVGQTIKLAAAVLVLITAIAAAPVQAKVSRADWSGPMYQLRIGAGPGEHLTDFDDVIEGSRASYRNGGTGVPFAVKARQLQRGHAYTLWLMAFNHPEHCLGGPNPTAAGLRCSQDDHLNPATGFSMMFGAGGVAHGTTRYFRGTRPANSVLNIPTGVVWGKGLVNPEGAEVHLRIRDHGPAAADRELREDQVSTFGGGCTEESAPAFFTFREDSTPGDYACVDIHTTAS